MLNSRHKKDDEKDEKTLEKLMNNFAYVKTKENLRNRIDVKLANNEKDYLNCTSKPNDMLHNIFDNNLVAILKSKVSLKLSKPVYTGMGILELSAVTMYEFHYDYIKNKCENKSKLLFGDTDSLSQEIKTENVYEYFSSNK